MKRLEEGIADVGEAIKTGNIKNWTAKDFKRKLRKEAEKLRQREKERKEREARENEPKTEVIGRCVCNGDIVIETIRTSEFNPESGPPIFGPGSRQQFRDVKSEKCFCFKCGLVYEPDIVIERNKK